MAKNNNKKEVVVESKKVDLTVLDRFNNWYNNNEKICFYIILATLLLLSCISFNARISEAHDDALYLEGGWRFVNDFPNYFYTANAPLYPLFLAILIKIIGFKLIIFKIFSMLFHALGFILFFKALSKKLHAAIFLPAAIFQAINFMLIYFSSMTFTESFYMFLQGLFFFSTSKLLETEYSTFKEIAKNKFIWLFFGLVIFLLATCKTVALIVIPVAMFFFVIFKNYKAAIVTPFVFLLFKGIYQLILLVVFPNVNLKSGQADVLLRKDPYDVSKGNEDFYGFVERFLNNCNLYMSKRFYQILGWRDEASLEIYGFFAFVTIALAFLGLWLFFKQKNKAITLFGLFAIGQAFFSFVALQARWDQPRVILVCMPILIILILKTLHYFLSKASVGASIYFVFIFLMSMSLFVSSFKRGFKNIPIVQKNFKGDKYYGYTADWQNFLKCSEYCADSLPKESFVASRKAPMSFVYGKGKYFYPIYSVLAKDSITKRSNADSVLAILKRNKVTHVIFASLRINPKKNTGEIINTVHNTMASIDKKYPQKLVFVKQFGEYESTYLYKINY